MDFVIFVLFGKGVDGTDFFAGFATGGINTLTVFAVRPAGRNEEPATVFALLVQYISLGKVHKFIEHFYLTEHENSSILLILSSWGKGRIESLTRNVVIELINQIRVYEDKRIEIIFRYSDKYVELVSLIKSTRNSQADKDKQSLQGGS